MTPPGLAGAWQAATAQLGAALAGVELAGAAVTVFDNPPVNANGLPAAWVEWSGSGSGSTARTVTATLRYLVAFKPSDNDVLTLCQITVHDVLEAARITLGAARAWSIDPVEIQIGGVDINAVAALVPVDYPATC